MSFRLFLFFTVVAVLVWAYKQAGKNRARSKARPRVAQSPREAPSAPSGASPHEILGVDPGATRDEIRRAYQDKIRQYHPDKVAHAAEELRDLAERRTKELNAAYRALVSD